MALNEKLLKTRLNSIQHYRDEIEKLSDALRVTKETLNENVQSLKEFLPFKEDDILVSRGRIFKVVKINHIYEGELTANLSIKYADGRYGGFSGNEHTESVSIENQDYKVITHLFEQKPTT